MRPKFMMALTMILLAWVGSVGAQTPPYTKISNPQEFEQSLYLGTSLAADGDTLLVGIPPSAPFGSEKLPGRFRSYRISGSGDWVFESEFTSFQAKDDGFGRNVSLSGDTAVVGAPLNDTFGTEAGIAYVYVRTNGIWTLQATLSAFDTSDGDEFGGAVSIDGESIVVGARLHDHPSVLCGAAYVFVRSGESWSLQAKLSASDHAFNDRLGTAVAISGDTVVASAPYDDDTVDASGSLYVFTRSGGVWSQQGKLRAPIPRIGRNLGSSLSLSGGTLVAGAPFDDEDGSDAGVAYIFERTGSAWGSPAKLPCPDPGVIWQFGIALEVEGDVLLIGSTAQHPLGTAAYMYRRSGNSWIQEPRITRPEAGSSPEFGFAVAVSGNRMFISDPRDSEAATTSGAVFVVDESGGEWVTRSKIVEVETAGRDRFGTAVALSGDTLAVGVEMDDDQGEDSGSAYIYKRVDYAWELQAKLLASDSVPGSNFGNSIAVDGDLCVVGAQRDSQADLEVVGSAYVFRRIGDVWVEEAKLGAPAPSFDDRFGSSVAAYGDTILIGARGDDDNVGNGFGCAYVFVRSEGSWNLQAQLFAPVQATLANFGVSVSLFGETALIGADLDKVEGLANGSAYVFVRSGTEWTAQARLQAPQNRANDQFGQSVSLYGDTAVIGAGGDDAEGSDAGAAYVFRRTLDTWVQEAKLLAADGKSAEHFGGAVSICDGTIAVGAPVKGFDGNAYQTFYGSAYRFDREGTQWVQRGKLEAVDAKKNNHYGTAIAAGETFIAVATPQDNDPEFDSGSVHVYEYLLDVKFESDGTPGIQIFGDTNQQVFYGDFATPVSAVALGYASFVGWEKEGLLVTTSNTIDVGQVLDHATYTTVVRITAGASGWEFYE